MGLIGVSPASLRGVGLTAEVSVEDLYVDDIVIINQNERIAADGFAMADSTNPLANALSNKALPDTMTVRGQAEHFTRPTARLHVASNARGAMSRLLLSSLIG